MPACARRQRRRTTHTERPNVPNAGLDVFDLSFDSREVTLGFLFVALVWNRQNAARYSSASMKRLYRKTGFILLGVVTVAFLLARLLRSRSRVIGAGGYRPSLPVRGLEQPWKPGSNHQRNAHRREECFAQASDVGRHRGYRSISRFMISERSVVFDPY